ncbi:hypothetical protein JXB37_05615, partial [candidate division WOR-3 bacterium]|nr:hypothetical protein [candidate division WOR-3 bacterium]
LERGTDIETIESLAVRERISRLKYLAEDEAEKGIARAQEEIEEQLRAGSKTTTETQSGQEVKSRPAGAGGIDNRESGSKNSAAGEAR